MLGSSPQIKVSLTCRNPSVSHVAWRDVVSLINTYCMFLEKQSLKLIISEKLQTAKMKHRPRPPPSGFAGTCEML